jgi:hypothetical protein
MPWRNVGSARARTNLVDAAKQGTNNTPQGNLCIIRSLYALALLPMQQNKELTPPKNYMFSSIGSL